jgi:CNT family concentrative nucleoside transporter
MPHANYRRSCVLLFLAMMLGLQAPAVRAQSPAAPPAQPAVRPLTRADEHGTPAERAQSLLGLGVFVLMAFGLGQLRRPRLRVSWRTVGWGLALQFAFAFLVLNTRAGQGFFQVMNDAVTALLAFGDQGARFVFGNLIKNNVPVGTPAGDPQMGPLGAPTGFANTGAFFAFSVLPTIIFFSALSTLAYHSGVMTYVVGGIAWLMQRSMKTSGAETLAAAGNIFLGQTEAPLLVRPFIAGATRSELMAIMVGGFANIASGVLAAYVGMLKGWLPDIAGHLIAASMISAPCSLVVAKLLLPEAEPSETAGGVHFKLERTDANAIDAAARGALEGMHLALNVAAMLIAFIGLVALLNALFGWVSSAAGLPEINGKPFLSFESLLGYLMAPLAWLMGVPWSDAPQVGSLLGIKTALNEFVAYLELARQLGENLHFIQPRSIILAAYALCGFANFASVAIQIGGISGMAPNRRGDLSRLGLYAMLGGSLSSFMTACVVGVLL